MTIELNGFINKGPFSYFCTRCKSPEVVIDVIEERTWAHPEYGFAEDWHVVCICSDCGKEFEVFDGYP